MHVIIKHSARVKAKHMTYKASHIEYSGLYFQKGVTYTSYIRNLFTHVVYIHIYTRVFCVLREQTPIAAIRLVWTLLILNSSKTSGSLSNGRALKMQKSFLEAKRKFK